MPKSARKREYNVYTENACHWTSTGGQRVHCHWPIRKQGISIFLQIQAAYYNSWTHDHYVRNVFVFAPSR